MWTQIDAVKNRRQGSRDGNRTWGGRYSLQISGISPRTSNYRSVPRGRQQQQHLRWTPEALWGAKWTFFPSNLQLLLPSGSYPPFKTKENTSIWVLWFEKCFNNWPLRPSAVGNCWLGRRLSKCCMWLKQLVWRKRKKRIKNNSVFALVSFAFIIYVKATNYLDLPQSESIWQTASSSHTSDLWSHFQHLSQSQTQTEKLFF